MVQSIVLSGLAIGCIYALIAIAYNVMFSASRVFSFTAGTLGMVGGILGSLFILRMGMPIWLGFLLALAGGALLGVVTELVAVRPVLKAIDQHLYVLSTLALALMVQQFAAIMWSTEPQPFPRIFDLQRTDFDQQFWLPMIACVVVVVGLEILYRYTLVGHAFLAIAEDNYAARALGLPDSNLRIASFALAGAIGALAGFAGGQLLLAFFANAPMLTFYGFVPVALGGMGNIRGSVIAGLILGLFQQAANFLVGGIFASVAVFAVFIIVLLLRPEGLAGTARRAARMTEISAGQSRRGPRVPVQLARICNRPPVSGAARHRSRAAVARQRLLGRDRDPRLHLLGAGRGAQSDGRLRRPACHRLGRDPDARRLRRLRAGGRQRHARRGILIWRSLVAGVRRRGLRADRRIAGAAAAHLLFRDHDARLCDHRHADRARLAERDRRRHRRARAAVSPRRSTRSGASTISASPSRRSAPG